jgi:hypothetical protein
VFTYKIRNQRIKYLKVDLEIKLRKILMILQLIQLLVLLMEKLKMFIEILHKLKIAFIMKVRFILIIEL